MTTDGFDPLQAPALRLAPAGPVTGVVRAPSSKSVTNRLLILASLAEGTSRLQDLLCSDDTAVMAAGLRSLGANVSSLDESQAVTVEGTGGHCRSPAEVITAGLSGTTLRFLACVALLAEGPVRLDGEEPLRRRPLGGLLAALEQLGATVTSAGGQPPLTITSRGLGGGPVTVDAAASSQFATGLLLVAPYAGEGMVIDVRNLGAAGYVDLTVEAMLRWGAEVDTPHPGRYVVAPGRHYVARAEAAEYDASAAAHLFALAMTSGGSVTVSNATATRQPDAGITDVFTAMGARVTPSAEGVTVRRDGQLRAVTVDVAAMPDQLPTLAVIAALASGTTRLTGVRVARGHETDRATAIAKELAGLGADVTEENDALVVRGGKALHGGLVSTYDDHRMAMALASLAAVVPGITISDPGCVRKTYPSYWSDLASLGLVARR
jgi:3-phosphoshikimate 1-carboxyvinyltransferase